MANETVDLNKPVVEHKEQSVDDLVDLFSVDDEPETDNTLNLDEKEDDNKSKEDKKEDKEDDKEIKDEEIDNELKLDEKEDEKIDEDEVIVPVKRSDILKKFPTIFKEFPQLQNAYYRSQEYYNTVGSISEAKELVTQIDNYKHMESALFNGQTDVLLAEVEKGDKKAFAKIVDNYLPNLAKVNQNAYYHVLAGVAKDTIRAMAHAAGQNKNEELMAAARILNQFIFQSTDFVPQQKFAGKDDEDNPEVQKLQTERQQFIQEKFNDANNTLQSKVDNKVKSAINKYIDPKGSMTDFVKKNASREVFESVEQTIANDSQFRGVLNRLWEKAFNSNFSRDSLEKIESTYLNKVRTLLPDAIKQSRSSALKGLGRKSNDDSQNNHQRIRNSGGESKSSGVKKLENGKPDLRGMSTLDILNMGD